MKGQPARFESSPKVVRTFCDRCGTPLTYQSESRLQAIDVTTITLDDADRFAPTKEIFLAEKLSWERANEAIEQYQGSSAGN